MNTLTHTRWWPYVLITLVVAFVGTAILLERWTLAYTLRDGLIFLVSALLLLNYSRYALPVLILLAPLSVAIELPQLDLKISFPTELGTLLLTMLLAFKFVMDEKFDRRILAHPLTIILLADLAWTLMSGATSTIPDVSLKRGLLKTGFIAMYFLAMAHWHKRSERPGMLYALYAIGLLYPIAHTLIVHADNDFSQMTSFAMPQPFFSDHTIYGACIAFVMPFMLIMWWSKKTEKRWIYGVGTIILLVALVLSYSRASWISLMACIPFLFLLKLRTTVVHLLILLTFTTVIVYQNFDSIYMDLYAQEQVENDDNIAEHLGSVTNLQTDASNLERINRWVSAYNMFLERPITGFGPGTYQFEYAPYQSHEFLTRISTFDGDRGHAHSEYFSALAETGLIGFTLLILIVFTTLHYGMRLYHQMEDKRLILAALLGLLTFFIHASFNGFLDYEKMAILVYGSMAVIVVLDLKASSNANQSKT